MTGKHRRPRASSGRTLAATAAVLTAGALPLAAAGSAFAAAGPAAGAAPAALQLTGEPGLQQVAQPLQQAVPLQQVLPLRQAAPLAQAVAADLETAAGSGQVPVGSLGQASPALQARDAAVDQAAADASAALGTEAAGTAGRVTSMLPVSGLVDQVAPAMAVGRAQAAPKLLPDDAVGTFNSDLAAKASGLAGRIAGQMQPTVQELRGSGVPTVGDITSTVGGTRMPLFGTVGGLTSAAPVGQMLGAGSPVIGAVGAAGAL